MFRIAEKTPLNPTVTKMVIEAPLVAKKAQPGQFIIVRPFEDSERIPLTIADFDCQAGTITIIFQIVGGTTMELNQLEAGQSVHDFVGPLGRASELEGLKKVAVVGGGVGCAIAYPTAKRLHELGAEVHSIVGFRSKDLVILEQEFEAVSDHMAKMSDDGTWGEKGLVTNALEALIQAGNQYDEVIAIGPLIMMKFVCKLTEKYGMKPSSPAWTAPTLTATRWTLTRPCTGAPPTGSLRPMPGRPLVICSTRRCSEHGTPDQHGPLQVPHAQPGAPGEKPQL